MLARRIVLNGPGVYRRFLSNESGQAGKRFMQTVSPTTPSKSGFYSGLKYGSQDDSHTKPSKWAKHTLSVPQEPTAPPSRKTRSSRFSKPASPFTNTSTPTQGAPANAGKDGLPPIEVATLPAQENTKEKTLAKPAITASTSAKKPRRQLKPRKALITLSTGAVEHLRGLLDQPEPQLIRIGVKNRGCSGLTYHLEYVTEPGKFDETVEQDGVKVLIDSKALFSIVGSEMDWLDDKLSSRFIFKNPNSKGTCGCGESFMV